MLRNRTFLTGLGTGIIVGALLLQLMLIGEQNTLVTNASSSGDNELMYSQMDVDTMVATELAAAEANAKEDVDTQDVVKAEATTKPIEPDSKDNSANEVAKVEPKQEVKQEVKEEKVLPSKHIQIKGGTNLTNTAELLADNGLLKDKSSFISKMKKSKKLVRAGYFTIPGGSTQDEIITIITSPPETKK